MVRAPSLTVVSPLLTTVQAAYHHDGPEIWCAFPLGIIERCAQVSDPSWSQILADLRSSPMSFFTTTDTGVTLNRFSQDLQLIDMELPVSALNTFASKLLQGALVLTCILC